MKPKTMILMVVAVACGLVASYLTSRLLADRNTQQPDNLIDVVVAKKKVPALTLIRKPEDLFEVRAVKEDGPITAKAIKSLDELKDKRLKNTLNPDSVVRGDDLQKKEDLVLEVPQGQRAVAIMVNAKSLAGGFILPGMRVDVISTMKRGDEPSSMILLQNMLVLAVDAQSLREDGKTNLLGQTVTLAATPNECQQLLLGAQQGELCLTLRSPDDKRLVTSTSTKLTDLGKGSRDRDPNTNEVTDGTVDQTVGALNLPKVEKEPTPPTPLVEPKVEVEEKKPEPKLVQHTLTVSEGAYTQQYVYTKDLESGEWRVGRSSANGDEAPPLRRPTLAVQPQPTQETKPDVAPSGSKPAPTKRTNK